MKPNLLRCTNYMLHSARNLLQHLEYATDELIQPLISLCRIDDCAQDLMPTDEAVVGSVSNPGTDIKILEQNLAQWKTDVEHCRDPSKRKHDRIFFLFMNGEP